LLEFNKLVGLIITSITSQDVALSSNPYRS